MNTQDFKRKLTAVFSADVAGYSRLMGENEAETVKTLTGYRKIMGEVVHQHRGRIIDSPGDNILAEFASVVDAVQCAVAAQNEFKEWNANLPENRRMEFRIGVNLGDVIEEESRIYGDGVNIAARLEGLAEAGGICISGTAFDQVKNKVPVGYQYQGKQTVKNIADPVRAYKVLMGPEAVGKVIGEKERTQAKLGWKIAAAVAVLLVVAGGLLWNSYWRAPEVEPASVDKMAFPLPGKPSIAVLPFVNMSEDPKQEYFSDGITEQIISGLSKVPNLFVIARNSTFTYKGKPVKVQKVAEDLGVKYVLEGSVQKSPDRLRITTQLIDATTGLHLWSERYDREPKDIFSIQDDITMEIMKAMRVELRGDQARMWVKHEKTDLEVYEKYLEGISYYERFTKGDNAQARQLFEEAIDKDPQFVGAYVALGWTHFWDARFGWVESGAESIKMALKYAQKAIELDNTAALAYSLIGGVYFLQRQYEKAMAEGERAAALNPNGAMGYSFLAGVAGCLGRWEDSINYAKKSIRLDPFSQIISFHWLGRAYFMIGQYDEAIQTFKKALGVNPDYLPAHAFLAASYISLGRETEAAEEREEVLRINPNFYLDSYAKTLPYKNESDIERYMAALRKAGLPEKPPLPLPDKPSIAVLPFVNMSDDKSQEFFSDGITEEIITALSKTPRLFVIARNSTFVYKDKPVNVQQVSRELGVKYVLEGSVRRSGDQLRITVQLIDATTGNHLWAERYDREMKEVFAIQDEVTMKITSALQVKLTEGESASILAKGIQSLDAYLKLLEGRELVRALNRDDNALARKKFEEAVALDPKSAVAYSHLGFTYVMDFAFGIDREESMKKAFACAQKALALDDSQPTVYTTMEFMYGFMRRHEEAIAAGEKAVRNSPGSAYAQFSLGRALNFACRDREALTHLEMAVRMDPIPPAIYYMHIGSAHLNLRNYEEAVSALKKALALTPRNEFARGCLIVAYVEMNRMEEARTEAQEYQKTIPGAKPPPPEDYRKRAPWKDEKVTERFIEAYRKLRS